MTKKASEFNYQEFLKTASPEYFDTLDELYYLAKSRYDCADAGVIHLLREGDVIWHSGIRDWDVDEKGGLYSDLGHFEDNERDRKFWEDVINLSHGDLRDFVNRSWSDRFPMYYAYCKVSYAYDMYKKIADEFTGDIQEDDYEFIVALTSGDGLFFRQYIDNPDLELYEVGLNEGVFNRVLRRYVSSTQYALMIKMRNFYDRDEDCCFTKEELHVLGKGFMNVCRNLDSFISSYKEEMAKLAENENLG